MSGIYVRIRRGTINQIYCDHLVVYAYTDSFCCTPETSTCTGDSVVKKAPANTGNAEVTGSIPGSGRSLGEGNGTQFSILAWKIPWTEGPDGVQSIALQKDTTEHILLCLKPI